MLKNPPNEKSRGITVPEMWIVSIKILVQTNQGLLTLIERLLPEALFSINTAEGE